MKQKGFLAKTHRCLIADFYLPKPHKLIVEIDGKYHEGRVLKDIGRDKFFKEERSIDTIRFTNEEVNNDINGVKQRLLEVLNTT